MLRLTSASLAPSAGLRIFKENGVSDEKLLYAGNVLAQLLDNDADGRPDDPLLRRPGHEDVALRLQVR